MSARVPKSAPHQRRRTAHAVGALVAGLMLLPAVSAQERVDRTKPPAIAPAPELRLPAIQKRTLSNGLAVWLVESHEVPLVQVDLLVRSGSGDDPAGKFGVASLTAAMLDEGAGARTSLQIADAVDFLGADLSASSTFDASTVQLNVPVARLGDALAIMADVALRPTFPDAELNRVRQERITALMQAKDDPASVAPMAFARVLFTDGHRYGTPAMGTETTLKAFTAADLRAFHRAMYQPANAALIVAGDVRMENVLPQLEKQFGAWRDTGPVRHANLPAAKAIPPHIVIVDMPGAAQSQIRIGHVGVARSTADYFPLQVVNTVLGGSFTSRLNQNLREEHGYTYGASSRFDMRLAPGPFFAAAGVQTDKTSEALREFFKELDDIRTPIAADELEKAKSYIALGLPGEFETLGDLAGHVEEQIVYALPDDYFARYVANVRAVTTTMAGNAAAAHLLPPRFVVVIVGDRTVIEPGIKALRPDAAMRTLTVNEALGQ